MLLASSIFFFLIVIASSFALPVPQDKPTNLFVLAPVKNTHIPHDGVIIKAFDDDGNFVAHHKIREFINNYNNQDSTTKPKRRLEPGYHVTRPKYYENAEFPAFT